MLLVVEDNDDDYFFLERGLKRINYPGPVHRVTDGVKAKAYLEGDGAYKDRLVYPLPNVLTVDIQMPRMNGFELITWLRGKDQFRDVPVYILSNSVHAEDVRKASELGVSGYIQKPSKLEDWPNLLGNLLS